MSHPAQSRNVPIQQQPMTWPTPATHQFDPSPPHLQMLRNLTGLFVQQKVTFSGYNKLKIFDPSGTHLLTARQNLDCCTGNNFSMTIDDLQDQPVLEVTEPVPCFDCFECFASFDMMEVTLPNGGKQIGRIYKEKTFTTPKFNLFDGQGNLKYKIKGPKLTTSWFGEDVKFKILMPHHEDQRPGRRGNGKAEEEVEVGQISKQWAGAAREFFTEADNFGIKFPPDANLEMKGVILGACLFIDWKYYDSHNNG